MMFCRMRVSKKYEKYLKNTELIKVGFSDFILDKAVASNKVAGFTKMNSSSQYL